MRHASQMNFFRDCEAVAIKLRKDKNMEKITDNSVYWAKVKKMQ